MQLYSPQRDALIEIPQIIKYKYEVRLVIFCKIKVETYSVHELCVGDVGQALHLPLAMGLLILRMSGSVGRLKILLRFRK